MSTFSGLVAEFPDIRSQSCNSTLNYYPTNLSVDFFRHHPDVSPPLACFLSHVHSDHLSGLESLRSPFVYCSAATREILLRLERYPCRINYAQGILETRQQTYKHLAKVMKPLPLETPTVIELRPGHSIQATLFDANHCPGAVMFLIEGDGKAILYTGDVRSEPWFVNALARNPILIEYTSRLKTLDKIYLDTSFTDDVSFQTKSEGIAELLRKVLRYPDDTIFYMQAWTYGYEDVWLALSRALKSPIHVDEYKLRVYGALRTRMAGQPLTELHLCTGAAALTGHMCGNTPLPGCLTSDVDVRLHSCEKGNMCSAAKHPAVVRIQPIVAHLPNGTNLVEAGVGGGGEDLEREAELVSQELLALLELITASNDVPEAYRKEVFNVLKVALSSGRTLSLNLDISKLEDHYSSGLPTVLQALSDLIPENSQCIKSECEAAHDLPRVIQFPYSRHSSYPELCHLIQVLRPMDIWPCTVDAKRWAAEGISIKTLFGQHCAGQIFQHDVELGALSTACTIPAVDPQHPESQHVDSASELESLLAPGLIMADTHSVQLVRLPAQLPESTSNEHEPVSPPLKRKRINLAEGEGLEETTPDDSQQTQSSWASEISTRHYLTRRDAYLLTLDNVDDNDDWKPIALLSTDGHHNVAETEL
ncbi:hypothetical protein RJ55_04425 [Drechmeria coniospora]|nr:hypothetical protein RJ55_04425 [Drechmeria coniospora]